MLAKIAKHSLHLTFMSFAPGPVEEAVILKPKEGHRPVQFINSWLALIAFLT